MAQQISDAVISEFEKGPGKLSDEFFKFLQTWISAHIRHIDMKYSPKVYKKSA